MSRRKPPVDPYAKVGAEINRLRALVGVLRAENDKLATDLAKTIIKADEAIDMATAQQQVIVALNAKIAELEATALPRLRLAHL